MRTMQFAQLSVVKQRVLVGAPLPFNVRDSDRTLLLARGHVVIDHEQMEALYQRGALVDIDEIKALDVDMASSSVRSESRTLKGRGAPTSTRCLTTESWANCIVRIPM
jgi:hypothetical protein